MYKIAIVGAGQLGSRHLQGLAKSTIDISIEVVEPFESSRKIAQQRYEEIANNSFVKKIDFLDNIEKLSEKLDLVIVATSANVRMQVVLELLDSKNVENLVLEKVLFQTINEYTQMERLLKETDTNCWVNHPRRMFPVYKELKEKLKSATQVSYNFQGGDWGLGCNGLHFIDHLAYLTDSTSLTLNNRGLDDKIYDSKREGFIEFNGLLAGKIDNHLFSLYSNREVTANVFTIVSDVLIAYIDESRGEIKLATQESNWEFELQKEKIVYFQSELSNILIEDVFIKNRCYLPTYKEAMNLHVPYIQCLLNHMEKIDGQEYNLCPIT